jgi:hypothetical protein
LYLKDKFKYLFFPGLALRIVFDCHLYLIFSLIVVFRFTDQFCLSSHGAQTSSKQSQSSCTNPQVRFPSILAFTHCTCPCRYYKVNEVQKFTFSRKRDESNNDVTVGFRILIFFLYLQFLIFLQQLWLERTNLVTSYSFPGILQWFPVTATHSVRYFTHVTHWMHAIF